MHRAQLARVLSSSVVIPFGLADGCDIRTVQELQGQKDVRTAMFYTHVLNRGGRGVHCPADGLAHDPSER